MVRKILFVFIFTGSNFLVEDVFASRSSGFSDNQWRYGLQYNEYESSNTSGYTNRSRMYGVQVGYRIENEGWSFLMDGSVGNLNGVERVLDNVTVRNLNLQDITWALNLVPAFNLNLGNSLRIYFGMGAAAELHFSKLPSNIVYTRIIQKDLQFGFGPVYVLGLDFVVGESSRMYFQYSFRDAEVPLFNMNSYKVIGPQGVIGLTW